MIRGVSRTAVDGPLWQEKQKINVDPCIGTRTVCGFVVCDLCAVVTRVSDGSALYTCSCVVFYPHAAGVGASSSTHTRGTWRRSMRNLSILCRVSEAHCYITKVETILRNHFVSSSQMAIHV